MTEPIGVLKQGCIAFRGSDGKVYEIPVAADAVAAWPFPPVAEREAIKARLREGGRFNVLTFWRDENRLIQSGVIDATKFVQGVV